MNDTIVEKIEYLEYLESVYNESRVQGELDFWRNHVDNQLHTNKSTKKKWSKDEDYITGLYSDGTKAGYKQAEERKKDQIESYKKRSSILGPGKGDSAHRLGLDNRSARKDRTKPVKSLADSYPSKKSKETHESTVDYLDAKISIYEAALAGEISKDEKDLLLESLGDDGYEHWTGIVEDTVREETPKNQKKKIGPMKALVLLYGASMAINAISSTIKKIKLNKLRKGYKGKTDSLLKEYDGIVRDIEKTEEAIKNGEISERDGEMKARVLQTKATKLKMELEMEMDKINRLEREELQNRNK